MRFKSVFGKEGIDGDGVRNIVISVKGSVDRQKHVIAQFLKQGIEFEFFDAITPNSNMEILLRFNLNIKTQLSDLEISCFLSHYMIWNQMVNEGVPYIGIFEDDIFLGENANFYLSNISWIPKNTHILKLEKGWQDNIKTSLLSHKVKNDRKLYRLKSSHFGTAGYILSLDGAKYLLKTYSKLEELRPVDVSIFGDFLQDRSYKVMQLSPAICIQDFILNKTNETLISIIEEGRSLTMESPRVREQKSIFFKIKREVIRPFKQLQNRFLIKKVDFK